MTEQPAKQLELEICLGPKCQLRYLARTASKREIQDSISAVIGCEPSRVGNVAGMIRYEFRQSSKQQVWFVNHADRRWRVCATLVTAEQPA